VVFPDVQPIRYLGAKASNVGVDNGSGLVRRGSYDHLPDDELRRRKRLEVTDDRFLERRRRIVVGRHREKLRFRLARERMLHS
jgi:hypothetical protein